MKNFKFALNGNNYTVEINSFESKGEYELARVLVNNNEYEIEIQHEQSKTPIIRQKPLVQSAVERKQITERKGTEKLSTVYAPIPGVIIKINLKAGDEVKMGETVLILEAMKMQNEIQAPRDGKIKSLKLSPEDSVYEGDVLFELE